MPDGIQPAVHRGSRRKERLSFRLSGGGIIAGKHLAPERRKTPNGKDVLLVLLAVVALCAVLVAVWAVSTRNRTEPAEAAREASKTTAEPVEKLTDSIDLPGYGALSFKADTREQEVRLPNPPQNFCYIRASLILEDGTVLWTSEPIAPGESSDPVVFRTPLAAGEYKNAVLKYECFRMDEALTPLNGATANLTLKVK